MRKNELGRIFGKTDLVVPSLLQVEHLNVSFATQTGEVAAVRDVTFSIPESGTLGLVGESGSGKSATSLAIMRLLPPQARTTGKITFAGADLLTLSGGEIRRLRGARISMIFQEPMTALNPVMRVGDQVAEAVLAHHRLSKVEAWTRTVDALREVAIPEPEKRARDYPHQLSGGQRQRVMIAMALVNQPATPDCRRAHYGARRHHSGTDTRAAGSIAGEAQAGCAFYLA